MCFYHFQLEIGSLEALCVQYIESSICQENVLVALDSAARLQLDPLKVWQLCLIVVNVKDQGLKFQELKSASLINNLGSLYTGSISKGLTAAGRAEKERAESEVAEGGTGWVLGSTPLSSILFRPAFSSSLTRLENLFTGSNQD